MGNCRCGDCNEENKIENIFSFLKKAFQNNTIGNKTIHYIEKNRIVFKKSQIKKMVIFRNKPEGLQDCIRLKVTSEFGIQLNADRTWRKYSEYEGAA